MFKKKGTFIIAEAGINHNGDPEIAKKLILAAKECGADAVKFQAFKTDELIMEEKVRGAEHDLFKDERGKTIFERLEESELSSSDYAALSEFAKKEGIIFFASVFGKDSLEAMLEIDAPILKIASCDLNNHFLLGAVAKTGKPVIISVGMGDIGEIKKAVKILEKGTKRIGILHCVSLYPPVAEELNLQKIFILKKMFPKHVIGYSDHTLDIFAPVAAVALGAEIIEKHFTLDKNMPGLDHARCADPSEFKKMVEEIRFMEKAVRPETSGLAMSKREKNMRKIFRRSIVADLTIPKGTKITKEMLGVKRPGTGIPSGEMDKVVGKIAKRDLIRNSIIKHSDLTQ